MIKKFIFWFAFRGGAVGCCHSVVAVVVMVVVAVAGVVAVEVVVKNGQLCRHTLTAPPSLSPSPAPYPVPRAVLRVGSTKVPTSTRSRWGAQP